MTLLDLTRELFTYLVVFRQRAVSAAPPSLETVNEELESILQTLEERAKEHPLLGAPYQQVRYGLTVLCDEVLLTSAWPQAVDWAVETLEERLYGSRQGDTRFFQLLEAQQGAPRDVLAIYYLCLGLGFCGCYAPDDPRLEDIKAGLLARLRAPAALVPPEPPPPRRPALGEQAPPPPAGSSPPSESMPPEPAEPRPAVPALPPEPAPLPPIDPGPPPRDLAAAPATESRPAPAPPPRRPAPAPGRASRGWPAAALALAAAFLAGALLWLTLGTWPGGAPPGKMVLAGKASPPPPAAEMSKAPEPPPPVAVETIQAPEPAPPPAVQAAQATEPAPPPAVETIQAPEPTPPPAVEMSKVPEPAPPLAVETTQVPEPAPPPAVETTQVPEPAPPPAPAAPQAEPGVYILHAGLYVGPIQSSRLAQRLKSAGLPAFVRQEVRGEGKVRYLVLVGPYKQEAPAQEAMERIQRRFGVKPFFLEPAPAPVQPPQG